MNFREYEEAAATTRKGMADVSDVSGESDYRTRLLFLTLAVNGEAGELGEKAKKYVREGDDEYIDGAKDELGDVLWYLATVADLLGTSLDEVAEQNIDKLIDRDERGVLHADGDNR